MAKKSMILKQQREPKFSTRRYNRCKICGRPHAYLRDYGICRICFRELAYKGQIPGVKKASWKDAPPRSSRPFFTWKPKGLPCDEEEQGSRLHARPRPGREGRTCSDYAGGQQVEVT